MWELHACLNARRVDAPTPATTVTQPKVISYQDIRYDHALLNPSMKVETADTAEILTEWMSLFVAWLSGESLC